MPGHSEELELPLDGSGGDSFAARPRKAASAKVKVIAVLMVMAIVGLTYLRFWPLMWQNEGGLPEEEEGVLVFMDVTGDKTLSGKNLTIKGDVIVRDGGNLAINGCNITMNGTFRVHGGLSVRGSTLSDFPAPLGFSGYTTLKMISNLTGCKWAWLNFTMEYDEKLAGMLHATASVGDLLSAQLWGAGKEGPEKVDLDLSPFCGAIVEVACDPGGTPAGYSIVDPVITTDRFSTPAIDMMVKDERNPYEVFDTPYPVQRPFQILMEGGNLEISNSTIASAGGHSDRIKANHTDILVANDRFLVTNTTDSEGVQFIGCDHCHLEVRSSTFIGGNGIRAGTSNVEVSDSLFMNVSEAIRGTDSALKVDRCRVMGCYGGVSAKTITSGTDSIISIRDSEIEVKDGSSGYGILINNISASVEDCRIISPAPLVIVPPADIAGGAASLTDFATISGNLFQACCTWYERRPDVMIFSGVPVSGMDELVRRNRWNTTTPAARYLIINESEKDNDDYVREFQYNKRGSAAEFDGSMQKEKEYRLDDEWTTCADRGDLYFLIYMVSNRWGDYSGIVPLEKFEATPTGYLWSRQDQGALQFRQVRESGTGTAEVDMGVLHRPLDILQLVIPVVPPPFDIGLCNPDVAYEWDTGTAVVSAGLAIDGLAPDRVNVTIGLDGKILDHWEMGPWSYATELYALDAGTIASGQLSITVSATNRMETVLANNTLTVPISVINGSRNITGDSSISGIWWLKKGASITISNCSLATNGTGVFFIGEGENRIDISRCAINITTMRLFNCSGRIVDSEILDGRPDGNEVARFAMEWGSWELDNVTFGARRAEYEGMDKEYRDDPSGVMTRYYQDELDWRHADTYIDISVENLTCRNISVYSDGCTLDAYRTLSVTGCRFLRCSPNLKCWGNMTLVENRFCFSYRVALAGGLVARNNTFSDIFGSVTVDGMDSNVSLTGNEFVSHPFKYGWDSVGLVLSSDPLVFEANLFTCLSAAIKIDGPLTDKAALMQGNSFSDIGFARGFSKKTVEFRMTAQDYQTLCLEFNRRIDKIELNWNDSVEARDHALENFYFWHDNPSYSTSFYDWVVDEQGRETKLDALSITSVLVAPSGAAWSKPMRVDVPAGDSLTIEIR